MNKPLVFFLFRYWTLVIITPSVAITSIQFFYYYRDVVAQSWATLQYEITKYLLPGMAVFIVAGLVLAFGCGLVQYVVLQRVHRLIRFPGLKLFFLLLTSCLFSLPFVLWIAMGNPLDASFRLVVIPSFMGAICVFTVILFTRRAYLRVFD